MRLRMWMDIVASNRSASSAAVRLSCGGMTSLVDLLSRSLASLLSGLLRYRLPAVGLVLQLLGGLLLDRLRLGGGRRRGDRNVGDTGRHIGSGTIVALLVACVAEAVVLGLGLECAVVSLTRGVADATSLQHATSGLTLRAAHAMEAGVVVLVEDVVVERAEQASDLRAAAAGRKRDQEEMAQKGMSSVTRGCIHDSTLTAPREVPAACAHVLFSDLLRAAVLRVDVELLGQNLSEPPLHIVPVDGVLWTHAWKGKDTTAHSQKMYAA